MRLDTNFEVELLKKFQFIAARVIYDRESGRSRGFGFVTFNGSEDASAAIQALDGQVRWLLFTLLLRELKKNMCFLLYLGLHDKNNFKGIFFYGI